MYPLRIKLLNKTLEASVSVIQIELYFANKAEFFETVKKL